MPVEERIEVMRLLRAVMEGLCSLHSQIEAGAPCGQLLRQFSLLQTELRAIKIRLLACQINASLNIVHFDPAVENRLAEIYRLFDLYNLLLQST